MAEELRDAGSVDGDDAPALAISGRRQGIVRLLAEAQRHGNDPALFAGLVHVCRYCGLNEEALAAHEEARRLDPNVSPSIEQTLLMMG